MWKRAVDLRPCLERIPLLRESGAFFTRHVWMKEGNGGDLISSDTLRRIVFALDGERGRREGDVYCIGPRHGGEKPLYGLHFNVNVDWLKDGVPNEIN